jgi:predicted nucleic acid-binding protein
MASFVVDASVTLSWCFEDEANAGADALLERLRSGDQVCVPAHWPTEVSNGLLMALRKKRIKPGRFELFWDQLAHCLLPWNRRSLSIKPRTSWHCVCVMD